MMIASIRARRAWESDDSITAMDYHRRSAELAEEAKWYADESRLDPRTHRILAGNAFSMQANAAQSAARPGPPPVRRNFFSLSVLAIFTHSQ